MVELTTDCRCSSKWDWWKETLVKQCGLQVDQESERCSHHLLGEVAAAVARKRQTELQAAVAAAETSKAVPVG